MEISVNVSQVIFKTVMEVVNNAILDVKHVIAMKTVCNAQTLPDIMPLIVFAKMDTMKITQKFVLLASYLVNGVKNKMVIWYA